MPHITAITSQKSICYRKWFLVWLWHFAFHLYYIFSRYFYRVMWKQDWHVQHRVGLPKIARKLKVCFWKQRHWCLGVRQTEESKQKCWILILIQVHNVAKRALQQLQQTHQFSPLNQQSLGVTYSAEYLEWFNRTQKIQWSSTVLASIL